MASNYKPGQSCYLLPDGSLLRPGNTNNTTFNAGGKVGLLKNRLEWKCDLDLQFRML
jgi:hypothetical protein